MQFRLDVKRLEQRYKELQWQVHPDRVTTLPPSEREAAADTATAVNHAYAVLREPLSRATYMVGGWGPLGCRPRALALRGWEPRLQAFLHRLRCCSRGVQSQEGTSA